MSVALLFLALVLQLVACKSKETPKDTDPIPNDTLPKAQVWVTSGDQTKLLTKHESLNIRAVDPTLWPVVRIDTSIRFQAIEGYGAALTGSSAYLINQKLSGVERQKLLSDLFDPEDGIGISYLRLTMGASDFSLSDFSYNDLPVGQTDFNLVQFGLSQDLDDVVPVMKEIVAISPDIGIMGSPWSPPAWMKTNGNMKGGKLKDDYYPVYADYFVRYIQAMSQEGIPIHSVTPQNEPLYFTANYPCMEMQADDQLKFVRDHLGPAFAGAGLNTKIILYDHNWDVPDYAISILDDPDARQYIAGSAFHAYGGNVSAMSTVKNAHPDKDLYFTEISGGEWATNFGDNLMWNMSNIFIGTALNWSKTALLWNLVLDQNHGPKNNGCQDCRGVVTLNTITGQLDYNEEYYSIGHFSKFVRPGAERVSVLLPQSMPQVGAVAFLNTDGKKVLVFCNYGNEIQTFTVNQHNKFFTMSLTGKSVTTIVWN